MSGPLSEVPEFQLDDQEEGVDEIPGMNMTPMVDVIFILLVFFLCVTQFKDQSRTLDVEVPKLNDSAAQRQSKEQKKPIVIEFDKSGKVVIAGVVCATPKAQEAAIKKVAAERGKLQAILLRIDGDVPAKTHLPVQVYLGKYGLTKAQIEYKLAGDKR